MLDPATAPGQAGPPAAAAAPPVGASAAAATAPPPPPPAGKCSFWLKHRSRYCGKGTPSGHDLCCNHGGGAEERVPCPADPRQ
jgi:hypothetical protein